MPTLATRYGEMAVPNIETDIIGRFLSRYGEWAWLEAAFVAAMLPANARVADVGAYVGTFGLGVARQRTLQALCCVEANPAMIPALTRNIESLAGCPVTVVEAMVAGLGATPRVGRAEPENWGGTSFCTDRQEGPLVEAPRAAVTLAALRAEYGPFDLIKFDIEGMEREVLSADADYLSRGNCAIWVECNEAYASLQLAELLLGWTSELSYFAFPAFNPDNFNNETSPIFPWAFEAGLLVFPRAPPVLTPELAQNACILRPIRSIDDLREALWRTPRWGMADWPARAEAAEIAALAGRSLLGLSYDTYLRDGAARRIEAQQPARPRSFLRRLFGRGRPTM